ncbi:hypothetical protein [Galactobacter valiniphilus]|uniref:hypothetical protein n=1 Tax=Galactobacter valiniphilus TaxID=2676122 RepID=UPI0037363B6A
MGTERVIDAGSAAGDGSGHPAGNGARTTGSAGRALRLAAAVAAAGLLAACTTGGQDAASSPPAAARPSSSASPATQPGAADSGDDVSASGDDSTVVGIATEEASTATPLPDSLEHPELGRGSGTPLATGTQSAGLTWADGTPVRLDVLRLSQARPHAAEELNQEANERWSSDIPGTPEGFSLMPVSTAGADGALGRGYAVAFSDATYSEEEQEIPVPRVGYVDDAGWHAGPEATVSPYYGGFPTWTGGGRLFWIGDGSASDPEAESGDWSISSWAPGEKRPTVVVDGKDHGSLAVPTTGVVIGASLYFAADNIEDYSAASSLYSVPVGGGKLTTVARNAGKPQAAGRAVVFERYFEGRTAEEIAFSPNSLLASVQKLVPGGTPQTLVAFSRAEVMRGLKQSESADEFVATDVDGLPISAVSLLSADAETVVIRQRGQVLVLRPGERIGTRLLPLLRPSPEFGLTIAATACKGGTAVLLESDRTLDPVLFWLPASGRQLGWLGDASPYSKLSCAGNVITALDTDPFTEGGTAVRVIRPEA